MYPRPRFHYGAALLLTINFHIQIGCPYLLSHSNNVVTAANPARYPFRIVLGLTHDYGLPCILLISSQTAPILGA